MNTSSNKAEKIVDHSRAKMVHAGVKATRGNIGRPIVLRPHLSEKASRILAEENAYLFIVDKNATKNAIKQAIEKRWGVKVKDVRTIRIKGTIKQRGGRITRKRKAFKKAIVSLEKGQKLELT